MSDKTLLAITQIMATVSAAIDSAQQAALHPASDASLATWRAVVGRVGGLLCDSCPCGCGAADCIPCMIENELTKARAHLNVLAVGSTSQTAYHTRLAVANLQAALALARDELHRAAAPTP